MKRVEAQLGREYNVVELAGDNQDKLSVGMVRRAATAMLIVRDYGNICIVVVHKVRVRGEKPELSIVQSKINDRTLYDAGGKVLMDGHSAYCIQELGLLEDLTVELVDQNRWVVPMFLDIGRMLKKNVRGSNVDFRTVIKVCGSVIKICGIVINVCGSVINVCGTTINVRALKEMFAPLQCSQTKIM